MTRGPSHPRRSRRRLAPGAALALLCLLPFSGCDDDGITSASDLQGGPWRLTSMQRPDFGVVTIEDPSRFTLEFDPDGRVSVRADCNGCGGTYTLARPSLEISTLVCTLILCPGAPLDAEYVRALEEARSVDLDGDTLRITTANGLLVFER